jgi:hypothetical protein
MEKIFNKKIFYDFFWTPLGSRVSIYIVFFQVHFKLSAVWSFFPLFATSVIYTSGKFSASVVDSGGNLPPVSTTLAKIVEKFAAGDVDTGGAPWIVNISENFRKNLKRS